MKDTGVTIVVIGIVILMWSSVEWFRLQNLLHKTQEDKDLISDARWAIIIGIGMIIGGVIIALKGVG